MKKIKTLDLIFSVFTDHEEYGRVIDKHYLTERDVKTLMIVARFTRLLLLTIGLCIGSIVVSIPAYLIITLFNFITK